MLYKTCTICKRRKQLDEFGKRTDHRWKGTPQGQRQSWCKVCSEKRRKERYQEGSTKLKKRRAKARAYGRTHRKERTTYSKEWHEATPFGWLTSKFGHIKKTKRKRYGHTTKIVKIDRDYLVRLWKRQKGICALTGVPMTTKYNDPFSASPDRIDNSKGYIPRNVQLVSKSAQFAKGNMSNKEFQRWLGAIKS